MAGVSKSISAVKVGLFAAASVGLSSTATPARAQAAPAAPTSQATSQDESAVEDLVVTARRVSEKLQDIPLAVSAVTGDKLRANNIVNVQSLNGLVPSLNYQFNGSRAGTGRVFFRGLTTGAGGQATRASIFLDGNYLAGSAQNVPFNYFQRVEALPGPQSAQFGRATFGGAINYVTKGPSKTFEGVVHADYASLSDQLIDGFIAGPLFSDRLSGSLFGSYNSFKGPEEWRTPPDVLHPKGIQQGSQELLYFASKLKLDATDDLTIRLGVSYAAFDDGPGSFYITPPGSLKNGSLQRYTANDLSRPIAGSFLRYPVGSAAYLGDFILNQLAVAQNFYNIADPTIHNVNWRYNAQIDWRIFNHDLTLNLFKEDDRTKGSILPDSDNTSFPASSIPDGRTKIGSKSAELRIVSPRDQRFTYSVGGYYLKFDTAATLTQFLNFRCTDVVNGCVPTSTAALFNPTLVNGRLNGYTGTAIAVNTRAPSSTATTTTDYAVFGMASYALTDQLKITAELRYQVEKLISRNLVSRFLGEATNKSFVPRYTLEYRFTPDVMAYAVYSVGTNPGGFNPTVASFIGIGATADMLSFEEEKLKNYELGFKSTLFDGRVTFNATIFQMDWIDQVSSTTLFATNGQTFAFNQNRGNSRVRGGELQLSVVPADGLTVNATGSYNDAKYVNYCSASAVNIIGYVTPGRIACFVVDGNYLENVPPMTFSLSADYRRDLVQDWELVAGATYRYRSGQWESDLNLAQSAPQNIVDLRIGAESKRFSVSVFCANCTNELNPDRATNLADARLGTTTTLNRSVSASLRRPRQFGVRTAFKF